MWTHMSPRLILFIFLPALVFEGAMSTDYYVFRHQFPSGVMLAGAFVRERASLYAVITGVSTTECSSPDAYVFYN